ncbi:hypothetical protein ADUPG1_004144, partial [Aduncisulcus paluster]
MREAKKITTRTKMSETEIEKYVGRWDSLRSTYDLDRAEDALKQKLLDQFVAGITNPVMSKTVSEALRELQRAQEPGTVVTLEAVIDLLEEEKKGLDKALEFAEQMNPALAKPRAPTRKALNKFKDEESGEELEFSELSLSDGTSK